MTLGLPRPLVVVLPRIPGASLSLAFSLAFPLALVVATDVSAQPAGAPLPPERPFPAATAVSKVAFESWPQMRELTDGSVLVVDQPADRIVRVNLVSGKVDEVMKVGAEENQFRVAGQPWAWRGDSTAILDLVKGRLMLFTPEGAFARSQPFGMAGGRGGAAGGAAGPPAGGRGGGRRAPQPRYLSGEFLFIEGTPPPAPPLPPGVSPPRVPVPIYRLSLAGRGRDSLGQILPLAPPRAPLASSTTGTRTFYTPAAPLLPADVWAAFDDGGIAIVRPNGYRIDFVAVDGSRARTDSIPYPGIPVTDQDRKRVLKHFRDSTAEVLRTSAERTQTSSVVFAEPANWPTVHPPFRGDLAPVVGPGDRLWLPVRCTTTEAAQCYDVIDRQGKRVDRWQLPDETYIVAFGKSGVYSYDRQKRGKERLQRHPLPVTP